MKTLLALLVLAVSASAETTFSATLGAGRQAILGNRVIQASFGNEERALLDGLRDSDPAVRVQALKGLKGFVANNYQTRDKVMDVLGTVNETVEVRREAARALSAAVADYQVRELLLKHAKNGNNPTAVRAMAYKALYWQTQYDSNTRDAVQDAAEREGNKEVRLAAIWALMYAGGDSDVRRSLLDMAQRSSDDVASEAAKSLYSQMGDSDVRRFARDAAERGSGKTRYAAIMMLATRHFDEDTRLLEDISKRDSDSTARQHAMTALAGHSVEVIYFFHQNHYQWMGGRSRLLSEAIDRE